MMVPLCLFAPGAAPAPSPGTPAESAGSGLLATAKTPEDLLSNGNPFAVLLSLLLGRAGTPTPQQALDEAPVSAEADAPAVAKVPGPRGKNAKGKPEASTDPAALAACGLVTPTPPKLETNPATDGAALTNSRADTTAVVAQESATLLPDPDSAGATMLPPDSKSPSIPAGQISTPAPQTSEVPEVKSADQRGLQPSPAFAANAAPAAQARQERAPDYPGSSWQSLLGQASQLFSASQASPVAAELADKVLDAPKESSVKEEPTRPARPASVELPSTTTATASINMPTADHRPAATAHAPPAVQVGNAIALHADELRRDGHSTLHLRLDPPGLGSVRVHLTATEQNVSARVVVEAESTRQLLEKQAGLLRDRLMESGVTLGRFTVACDSSGGGWQQGASPQPPREELPLPLSKPRLAAPSSRPRIGNGLVDVVV